MSEEIIKFKSFREQGLYCDKIGNRFIIHPPYVSLGVIVCIKYKTYCHSGACFEDRKKLEK